MKIFKSKVFLLLYIALLTSGAVFWYIRTYVYKTRAAAPTVNVTLSPKTGEYPAGFARTTTLVIQPATAGQKISGFDIAIAPTNNNIVIDAISNPVDLNTASSSGFTKIIKNVASDSARLVYAIVAPDKSLPQAISMRLTFKGVAASTQGSLKINSLQVSGNIPEYVYDKGILDQGDFNFVSSTQPTPTNTPTPSIPTPTHTPIPTLSLTPTRTPTPTLHPTITSTPGPSQTPAPGCSKLAQGDANCDDVINVTDFEIWRGQYLTGQKREGENADFDSNGRVDTLDFEAWRKSYTNR